MTWFAGNRRLLVLKESLKIDGRDGFEWNGAIPPIVELRLVNARIGRLVDFLVRRVSCRGLVCCE